MVKVNTFPDDWNISKLNKLGKKGFQNGVFFEGSRKGKGVLLINVSDLYGEAPVEYQNAERFDATFSEMKNYSVEDGDLFFTRSSIVPSGIAQCNWINLKNDETVLFDSHVIRFSVDSSVINSAFLYYQCIAPYSRNYFVSHSKTAIMTTIDQSALGGCPIAFPEIEEQKDIVGVLSNIDLLIRRLEKLLAKKKALKQGAMQELLTGKRRLDGYVAEWKKYSLDNLLYLRKEKIIPQRYQKTICIEMENIESKTGRIVSKTDSQKQKSLKSVFYPNDILWGKLRPYLRKYAFPDFKGVCSTEIWVFSSAVSWIYNRFMYYILQTDWFFEAANATIGTKMPRADWNILKDLQVSIPSEIEEQKAIAEILSDMDAEIDELEKKLAKYRQLKQGMMSELLTGRIRLE